MSSPSFIDYNKSDENQKYKDIAARFASLGPITQNFDIEWRNDLKKRVRALKKLQYEKLIIDGQLNKDMIELEMKYASKYAPILEKRREIINGTHEPEHDYCDFDLENRDECDESLVNDLIEKLNISEKLSDKRKGMTGFWLFAMKNDDDFSEWIESEDQPVLMCLTDIKAIRINPLTLVLEFHFSSNDYFDNEVLTKEYNFRCEPNPTDPWNLQLFAIIDCNGCEINWKTGKNLMEKTIIDKESDSGFKVVKTKSFFQFFSPKNSKSDKKDYKTEALLANDWKLGKLFYSSLIPNAVLYFTSDIFEDYSESESTQSESDSYYTSLSSDDSFDQNESNDSPKSAEFARKHANRC